MTRFDLPLEALRTYRPARLEPADFDSSWAQTLDSSRAAWWEPRFEAVESPFSTIDVADVTFAGYAGQPIKGWLLWPRGANRSLTTIVEFMGYGGGRGRPVDWSLFPSAGYAYFVMDTRGQGSAWLRGDTPDIAPTGAGPEVPGVLTRGIRDPQTHYYRRLMTDAVLAVDAARYHGMVAADRVTVAGGSQGGSLALAAAALAENVKAAMIDVPFLCHVERALEVTDREPYNELRRYLQVHHDAEPDVFRTLSYVDGRNFAARAGMPALFSVGLEDDVTPPSTVFATFNEWAGAKDIRVWPWQGHDAGGTAQSLERLRFLRQQGLLPSG